MYYFMILCLSLYVQGRSFSMVCIWKCGGALRMCMVVLGVLVVVGVEDVRCVLVVLCV